jgi:hypothetical protein
MSRENAELVRASVADWNARDWEAWKAKHHEQVVVIPPDGWPEEERPVGREAWFRQALRLVEPWDEQRIELDAIRADGDRVVASFRWLTRGRESRLEVDWRMVGVFTVTDRMIERVEFSLDEHADAVGLPE